MHIDEYGYLGAKWIRGICDRSGGFVHPAHMRDQPFNGKTFIKGVMILLRRSRLYIFTINMINAHVLLNIRHGNIMNLLKSRLTY